ncbi:hypothetical protein LCGC14_0801440 [marine sediment metagenome]|uniref:Uncharacterized protein n=1 Tax=marine sediment metagenome TaxID=412755 RepID=A0A0F9S9F4_9ZZZZ
MSNEKDVLLHITISRGLKDKLEAMKGKSTYSTITGFVREAIRDKLRRMENPNIFNPGINPETLDKIYKLQLEQNILLKANMNHKTTINGNMKELGKRLKGQQVELYKDRIVSILKQQGSLRVEGISDHTDIEVDEIIKVLTVLQELGKVELNMKNGRWMNI